MSKGKGGNFVCEWYGYRVYPTVADTKESLADQSASRCPFLTEATGLPTKCIKPATAQGVCTVSSVSNGPRQDWLVCPQRTITSGILYDSAKRLFHGNWADVLMVPGPTLERDEIQKEVSDVLDRGGRVVAYLQEKLGGEVSISGSKASPELSFDFTMAELVQANGIIDVGRYGILEVQTMDYHGSYRQVVEALHNALNLHGAKFAENVAENSSWLSGGMEGPNVANVFKRTFYQTVLKFKLAEDDDECVGCVLALPQAVWDSWAKHLGEPQLVPQADGTYVLEGTEVQAENKSRKAWIFIFDIDAASDTFPNPVIIKNAVLTDASAVSYHALERAAEAMVMEDGPARRIQGNIRTRLRKWWPLVGSTQTVPGT